MEYSLRSLSQLRNPYLGSIPVFLPGVLGTLGRSLTLHLQSALQGPASSFGASLRNPLPLILNPPIPQYLHPPAYTIIELYWGVIHIRGQGGGLILGEGILLPSARTLAAVRIWLHLRQTPAGQSLDVSFVLSQWCLQETEQQVWPQGFAALVLRKPLFRVLGFRV